VKPWCPSIALTIFDEPPNPTFRLGPHAGRVVAKLEALRTGLNDSDDDVVLEVLDFVTGWCSPHARL